MISYGVNAWQRSKEELLQDPGSILGTRHCVSNRPRVYEDLVIVPTLCNAMRQEVNRRRNAMP